MLRIARGNRVVHNKLGSTQFGSQKHLAPIIYGSKIEESQKNFFPEKSFVERNVWSKKCLVQTCCFLKLGPNQIWVNKNCCPKIIGSKKMYGSKQLWIRRNFVSKEILGKKILVPEKFQTS